MGGKTDGRLIRYDTQRSKAPRPFLRAGLQNGKAVAATWANQSRATDDHEQETR